MCWCVGDSGVAQSAESRAAERASKQGVAPQRPSTKVYDEAAAITICFKAVSLGIKGTLKLCRVLKQSRAKIE